MKKKIGDLTLRELVKINQYCKRGYPTEEHCAKCPLNVLHAECPNVILLRPEPPAYEGMIFNQEIEVEEKCGKQ